MPDDKDNQVMRKKNKMGFEAIWSHWLQKQSRMFQINFELFGDDIQCARLSNFSKPRDTEFEI